MKTSKRENYQRELEKKALKKETRARDIKRKTKLGYFEVKGDF